MERRSGRTKRKEKFLVRRQVRKREPVRLSSANWQIANNMDEVGKGKQQKKENRRKLIFWNVAGIERHDKGFWNYIVGFDFIGLCKTWL